MNYLLIKVTCRDVTTTPFAAPSTPLSLVLNEGFLNNPRNHLTSDLWVNTSLPCLREVSAFCLTDAGITAKEKNEKGLWPKYTVTRGGDAFDTPV